MTTRTATAPEIHPPRSPRFDAGRLCLDLLATTHPCERLPDAASLTHWITASGLVPPGTTLPAPDPDWLTAFRELRGVIGRLIESTLQPEPVPHESVAHDTAAHDTAAHDTAACDTVAHEAHPYDRPLAVLNDAARPAPPVPHAVLLDDGHLTNRLAEPPTCAALLSALARDALDLLTDPASREALRQCEGDNCPVVYLDTSRGRRRRWCSSEICGNRERVARHRRRAAVGRV
ncbi:CGNR zinc finger domain-containing protein [Streptomyces sp. S6]